MDKNRQTTAVTLELRFAARVNETIKYLLGIRFYFTSMFLGSVVNENSGFRLGGGGGD